MNKKNEIVLKVSNEELAALAMLLANHLLECGFDSPLIDIQTQLVNIVDKVNTNHD